jgi:hypothetical protein
MTSSTTEKLLSKWWTSYKTPFTKLYPRKKYIIVFPVITPLSLNHAGMKGKGCVLNAGWTKQNILPRTVGQSVNFVTELL